jgi:hypothetical protein
MINLIRLSGDVVMAAAVAVERDYVERIQSWVAQEASKFARNERESGVNAYSRHTSAVLSKHGLDGFAPAQISRWIKGDVVQEIKGETLSRLGILKGLSSDPDEAATKAYLWLNGQEVPETAKSEAPVSAPLSHPLVAQVEQQQDPDLLHAIAVTAIGRLKELAYVSFDAESEDPMPRQTPLTNLLTGWMQTNSKTAEDLADLIGCSVARVEEIMSGASLTMDECKVVAPLTNLDLATLMAWGSCKVG